MSDRIKTAAIVNCLKSTGYRDITLRALPILFLFRDAQRHFELEIARLYFQETDVDTLRAVMIEHVVPALKTHMDKKNLLGCGWNLSPSSPQAVGDAGHHTPRGQGRAPVTGSGHLALDKIGSISSQEVVAQGIDLR